MTTLPTDVIRQIILPFVPCLFLNVNKYYNWHAINLIISNNYSNNNELLINYTRFNNTKLVDTILKQSKIAENYLMQALQCAIKEDYSSMINIFLSFNPNLTIKDYWCDTAEYLSILSYTAGYGSDRTFENLLQSNLFDPTANFNETLRITLRERQLNKLTMLVNDPRIDLTAPIVDYGSSLSAYFVEDALCMAVICGWLEAIILLLEQPSIVPIARALDLSFVGDTPDIIQKLLEIKRLPQTLADLELACREARDPTSVLELLKDSTLQLEPHGGKALYNACLADKQAVIKLLLDDPRINEIAVLQNIENYPQQLKNNFLVAYAEWKRM